MNQSAIATAVAGSSSASRPNAAANTTPTTPKAAPRSANQTRLTSRDTIDYLINRRSTSIHLLRLVQSDFLGVLFEDFPRGVHFGMLDCVSVHEDRSTVLNLADFGRGDAFGFQRGQHVIDT